jgi:hypothetical protein
MKIHELFLVTCAILACGNYYVFLFNICDYSYSSAPNSITVLHLIYVSEHSSPYYIFCFELLR